MTPTISIGLPVFNGEKYLAHAIGSILGQSYSDFELIISDNASEDGTQKICHEFAQRDSRIRYFRQPANLGAPRNFNFVFEHSEGHYFKWASDNDLCDADLLTICKKVLDERREVVLCFGKTMTIDEDGQMLGGVVEHLACDDARPSRRFVHLVDHMFFNNVHAGLFRSEILRKTKLDQPYPAADLVLIAELALHGLFCEVPKVLFYRRETPGAATKFRNMGEIMKLCRPESTTRRYWPMWRSSLGYFQAVLRSPVAITEKATLCNYLLKRCYRSRRCLLNELVKNIWG